MNMNSKFIDSLKKPEDEIEFLNFLSKKINLSEDEASIIYKRNQVLGTALNRIETQNDDLHHIASTLEKSLIKLQFELQSLESQKEGKMDITKKAKRSSSEMGIFMNDKRNTKEKCFQEFQFSVEKSLNSTLSKISSHFTDFEENIESIRDSTISRKHKLH